MQQQKASSPSWRIKAAVVGTASALIYGSAVACTPAGPNIPIFQQSDDPQYNFVAVVVGEEIADDPRRPDKKMVAALRLRVLSSEGPEPTPGVIVAMGYQYTGSIDSMCRRVTRELTLRVWSAGTRVRILSNDLYSAESMHIAD